MPLLRELGRQGIEHQLFFGADGRQGLSSEMKREVDRPGTLRELRRPMTDGEYACALSHRAIHRRIVADDLDAALVLEDDAIVSPRPGAFVEAGGLFVRPMILLDRQRVRVVRSSGDPFPPFGRLWRVVGSSALTTGYAVSHDAARHLDA
ncbi:glycosyl transferase family 25 [Hasllibacter halocynthiae]|uniref:Glycosyl transferase family 25 n=1 Tax=Hasllibacter halocynthiae TaxID=595589 RepID=A0A2T0X1E2_9RHOB|nr:glycosyl transferase family 25 [Hasllibacter halocynthiae]